jgi:signal transduction histidine kinase
MSKKGDSTVDGISIYAYDLPKIFDRLYRADKSRSQKGLGLNLVRAVVPAHLGEIRVKIRPGEGSVFTIILPKNHNIPPLTPS